MSRRMRKRTRRRRVGSLHVQELHGTESGKDSRLSNGDRHRRKPFAPSRGVWLLLKKKEEGTGWPGHEGEG